MKTDRTNFWTGKKRFSSWFRWWYCSWNQFFFISFVINMKPEVIMQSVNQEWLIDCNGIRLDRIGLMWFSVITYHILAIDYNIESNIDIYRYNKIYEFIFKFFGEMKTKFSRSHKHLKWLNWLIWIMKWWWNVQTIQWFSFQYTKLSLIIINDNWIFFSFLQSRAKKTNDNYWKKT